MPTIRVVMVLALFRRGGNRRLIEQLHAGVVAAARNEAFYRDYGVADTVDGRFEMLVLHVALAVRRLRALPSPGPDIAQDLTDAVFRHFDSTLREAGIGDTSVPKRMKKLAESFYGRAGAYEPSLAAADHDGLAAALARNVFGTRDAGGSARRLARWAAAAAGTLETASIDDFMAGRLAWPDPARIE